MKRIILTLAIIAVSAGVANAQVRPDAERPMGGPEGPGFCMPDTEYVQLLTDQNQLLGRIRTSIYISLAGSLVPGVCEGIYEVKKQANPDYTIGGGLLAGVIVGEAAIITGGVMLLVNELKLIKNQRQINDHLILRATPGGLALEF